MSKPKVQAPFSNGTEFSSFLEQNCYQCKRAYIPNMILSDEYYLAALAENKECKFKYDLERSAINNEIDQETLDKVFGDKGQCKDCLLFVARLPGQEMLGINPQKQEASPGQLTIFDQIKDGREKR